MYFCNFSINSNCGLSEAAEKLNLSIISIYVFPNGKINYVLAYTEFDDASEIKKYLKKDFKLIKIYKSKINNILFINGLKKGHNIMNIITYKESIPLFPIFAESGKEIFSFLTFKKNLINEIIDNISKNNDISYFNCNKVKEDEIFDYFIKVNSILLFNKLTSTERLILKKAYFNGYYKWPRQHNLDFISDMLNLSKPTVLYHIRNAERKVFDNIINNL